MTLPLITALETLINHYIQESSVATDLLSSLSGRSLALQIEGLGYVVRLDAGDTHLIISGERGEPAAATATISGSPLTLLGLANTSNAEGFRESSARMTGDTETAETFAELLRHARPEIEEELSRLVGDLLAHEIAESARRTRAWADRALAALTMNTSEFLQEESRQLPPRVEVEDFHREVERLREDIDRAAYRVDRLTSATDGGTAWDGSD